MSDIRWKQRFQNLTNAFAQLEEIAGQETLNKFEQAGMIQTFEFTFELAWKTLKDFLEHKGFTVPSPRDTIKQAFQEGYIEDGRVWIDALDKRNLMAHTYDKAKADEAAGLIKERYLPMIRSLHEMLKKEAGKEGYL